MSIDETQLCEWTQALNLMLAKERDAAQKCINEGAPPLYWEGVVDAMDNAIEWLNVNLMPGSDDMQVKCSWCGSVWHSDQHSAAVMRWCPCGALLPTQPPVASPASEGDTEEQGDDPKVGNSYQIASMHCAVCGIPWHRSPLRPACGCKARPPVGHPGGPPPGAAAGAMQIVRQAQPGGMK